MIKNVFIQNLTEWLNETFISLKDSLLLGDLSKAALALHWNTRLLLCLNKHFYLWSCSWGLVWLIHLRCCMRSTSSWARSRRCGRGSMQPPLQTRWKTAARRSFWPTNNFKHVFVMCSELVVCRCIRIYCVIFLFYIIVQNTELFLFYLA